MDKVLLPTKYLQLKEKPGELCPIFIGLFRLSKERGRSAMKLDIPASLAIHPVFNVYLLKKYYRYQLLFKAVQVKDDAEYK